jgi:hypothetical protein
MDDVFKPRLKGRPRKIIQPEAVDKSEESDNSSTKTVKAPDNLIVNNKEELKIAKLKYKHDNIDKVRAQQNERYNKLKAELAVKRLLHTILSEKYSNEQRKQLLTLLLERIKEQDNSQNLD